MRVTDRQTETHTHTHTHTGQKVNKLGYIVLIACSEALKISNYSMFSKLPGL